MGTCTFCGKPAGIFRTKHSECEERFNQQQRAVQRGLEQIALEVASSIAGAASFDGLEKTIAEIERSFSVPLSDRKALLIKAWEDAVEKFLEDGVLNSTEERRLVDFKEKFVLSQDELDRHGALTRTVRSAVLRDVLNGVVPQRASIDTSLAINFQKNEQVVWAFSDSKYLEDKIRRQFVGASQGVSVRLMQGVYYRVGAFKGEAVEHTERVHVDTGWMVATNKNLYFAGPRKSVRVPYTKIVSFEPFSDGIGIMRDAASAKPQLFITGDGWFTYNLITNLAKM